MILLFDISLKADLKILSMHANVSLSLPTTKDMKYYYNL